MWPALTLGSNSSLFRVHFLCVIFSFSETFKSPWFLVASRQCVLLIPLADVFTHTWRLKGRGKKKTLQKVNHKLENLSRKC